MGSLPPKSRYRKSLPPSSLSLYPPIAAGWRGGLGRAPDLAFRPTANWPALHQEVNDGPAQAEALRAGWDELQAERRANGTHAKFCGE